MGERGVGAASGNGNGEPGTEALCRENPGHPAEMHGSRFPVPGSLHTMRSRLTAERAMPTFTIPGKAGPLHFVDLREESPTPSGSLPIVFVHGMVGHTGFWNAALAACADRRRAIALDLRGHG